MCFLFLRCPQCLHTSQRTASGVFSRSPKPVTALRCAASSLYRDARRLLARSPDGRPLRHQVGDSRHRPRAETYHEFLRPHFGWAFSPDPALGARRCGRGRPALSRGTQPCRGVNRGRPRLAAATDRKGFAQTPLPHSGYQRAQHSGLQLQQQSGR